MKKDEIDSIVLTTSHKMLTRKECILVAEEFTRSAFKGISVVPSETTPLSKSFLGRVLTSSLQSEDDDDNSPYAQLRQRAATRRDLRNADLLIEAMRHTNFTQRQAKILYLRSFCFLSWKRLASIFDMSWDRVRQEYDDALHEIYYRAKL